MCIGICIFTLVIMVYNVQVIDTAEVSDETDTESQVDQNAILRSKKVSKSLSKKRNKKKVKATITPVEITMHTEDDKMKGKDSSVKSDLSVEGQCGSDVTSDSLLSFQ